MQRRNFLETSAVAALGALAFPNELLEFKKVKQVGVQLYTVRDAMQKDAMATLKKIADIGYKDVELAGYNERKVYGKSVQEFKMMLDDLGLTSNSTHMGLNVMRGNFGQAVADAKALGHTYIVCPYLPDNERKTIDQYKKLADELNKAGAMAKRADIQFAYHNHAFEFETLEGQIPMDVLLSACDADLVKIELDLYWATKAGQDPVEYFKKAPGRFHLWHVKDMANTTEKEFATVGSGTIDFKKIFQNAKLAGVKHFYVEQDAHKTGEPLANIETSYKYLKGLRY